MDMLPPAMDMDMLLPELPIGDMFLPATDTDMHWSGLLLVIQQVRRWKLCACCLMSYAVRNINVCLIQSFVQ